MTRSELGALVRDERRRRKLSLYRVAVRAQVHPNTVALAERGAVSEAMLARIATALEVRAPLDSVNGGEGDEP
jgi:transcriptional regulator with XRE-family HTH domain